MKVSPLRVRTLPLALFLGTSAWSFVYVSLPFYIQRISTEDPVATLRWTGWILGISPLVTVIIAPFWGRLADLLGERRAVAWFLTLSSAFLALLGLTRTVWSFGVVRFLQALCVAPGFPLAVARIAQRGGQAIGLVNSSRIGASFVGPVLATTVLTWTTPGFLYALLAVLGLACLPLARRRPGPRPDGAEASS